MTDANHKAYPISKPTDESNSGLTKRELFAAMAMQGLLSAERPDWKYEDSGGITAFDKAAQQACDYADALIKALNTTA